MANSYPKRTDAPESAYLPGALAGHLLETRGYAMRNGKHHRSAAQTSERKFFGTH
jgi:hypothetical protein